MDIYNKFNELIKSENKSYENNVIGVLSEKTLHKTIKNLYEQNHEFHEVKIDNYFVDVLKDNNIIEVQTKQFNKIRDKLNYLLSLNKYKINLVFPVFNNKTIYFIQDSIYSLPKKSPKKLKYPEIFYELYKIKQLLNNKDLIITILVFDINEYRIKENNRKGYICFDRVPTKLINEIIIKSKEDYLMFLPNNLQEKFTSKDICVLTKSNIKYVNKMLNVLKYVDVLDVIGKDGRKYVYSIKKG